MRVAPAVPLSPEESARLVAWSRGRGGPAHRRLRARIILRAAEGRQDLEIARELGVSRPTVARWRRRFLVQRLRAVEELAPRRLRPGKLSADRLRAIVTAARPPPGSTRWPSLRRVARAFGVSHSTVRRVWNDFGVRAQRFEPWPSRADPVARLVPVDVVGVHLGAGRDAVVFALGPAPPRLDGPPAPFGGAGRPPDRTPPYAAGERDGAPADAEGLVRFLDTVASRLSPAGEALALVAGPGDVERGLAAWRGRHPRVAVEVLGSPEAWRDRLTSCLSEVSRGRTVRGGFGSRGEAARALRLALGGFRAEAGPFEWVAGRRAIASGAAGFLLRHALSGTGHGGFKPRSPVPTPRTMPDPMDPSIREMAKVVLRRSLRVRKGERVTIETWSGPVAYANAFVLEALEIGARPLLVYQDEPTYWSAATKLPSSHLAHVGEHLRAALRKSHVFVSFFGPSDRERFHALPRTTRNRLGEYRDELYEAAARAGGRAVQMAIGRVSEPSARMYGVDLETWRRELVEAAIVDPELLRRRANRLLGPLRRGRRLTIRHPNGTEVEFGLKAREPQVSDGRVRGAEGVGGWSLEQLPGGVVQVALDERRAEGSFVSNVPNSVGVMDTVGEVEAGRWTFRGGRLARYSYAQGGALFQRSYERAGRGRDRPGTLSIGLNERIDLSPLLLDQGLGTLTLQIGRNDFAGGSTKLYWWAWLVLRGADLAIDGVPFLKGGRLVG